MKILKTASYKKLVKKAGQYGSTTQVDFLKTPSGLQYLSDEEINAIPEAPGSSENIYSVTLDLEGSFAENTGGLHHLDPDYPADDPPNNTVVEIIRDSGHINRYVNEKTPKALEPYGIFIGRELPYELLPDEVWEKIQMTEPDFSYTDKELRDDYDADRGMDDCF
jgi:hypothetical protein